MGIKGINTLIKRYSPEAFFTLPITSLSGKRIAIDGNNWMYTSMAIARKKIINKINVSLEEPNPQEIRKEWFLLLINFLMGWLSYDITPVFVFDGTHPPEKDETKLKRKNARIATKIKIDALYKQIRDNTIERSESIIEELRKELRNYNFISTDDYELFRTIINRIGIPCLQATCDGEQLCSSLCIEGKVAAVFSVDTDNLVYGCPLIVTGYSQTFSYDEFGNKIDHLDCVRLDKVLNGLKVSHSIFVDLCIMSGCDFNTNIPGYAAIKSFNLLQKYGSIDNLPRNLNITCLNYLRCRNIFSYVPSEKLIVSPDSSESSELPNLLTDYNISGSQLIQRRNSSFDIDKTAIITARDHLEIVGISGQMEKIIKCYDRFIIATDGYIEKLNLDPPPKYIPPTPIDNKITLNINHPTIFHNKIVPKQQYQSPSLINIQQPKISTKYLTLNIISPDS
jgi:flap endonuclease-1